MPLVHYAFLIAFKVINYVTTFFIYLMQKMLYMGKIIKMIFKKV